MTDRSWETLDSEIAYSCDGFDIVTEEVRLPDGAHTDFDYLSDTASVVILPFTTDDDVIVIEEWREAVKRLNRGLPAGNLEPGEDPDAATRRELREETGYEAGTLDHMTTVEPANGYAESVFHYYVARDCEQTGGQELDRDETITVETTSIDELVAAAREDDFRDGRSAFGVLYYALFESDSDHAG